MKRITLLILIVSILCWPVVGLTIETPKKENTATADGGETAGEDPSAEESEDPLIAKGRALLEQVKQSRVRIDGLKAQAAEAEGEDLGALELQIMDAKLQGLDVVNQLVANLVAQEAEEIDASELRKTVESLLEDLLRGIRRNIDATNSILTDLRKQRDSAAVEDIQAYELRISRAASWLNTLFTAYSELIYEFRSLGLDATEAIEDVTEKLIARADLLEGRVALVTQQLAERKKQAVDNPDDSSHAVMIQALETRKQTSTSSLSELTGLMDRFGLETSKYRKLLIKSTGEITTDVFRKTVFVALMQDWFEAGRDWVKARGPAIGFRIIVFTLILVAFSMIARITRFIVSRRAGRSGVRKSKLVQNMLEGLAGKVIMIIGFLVALSTLGIRIGPLLTGLGIAGFIVGFALQDSLSNFAAGIMILGYRPFDIDDLVETGGVFGRVSDMSLVSTTILTIDNQTLIVPNGKIWGDVIKNITHQNRRRVDMKFRIAYTDDVDVAERILMEIITSHDKVLEEPAPAVRLHELGEFAMEIVVRPWVRTEDYWEVYWDVTREVKRRFDAEGITIPLPQREIYVHQID